MYVCMYVCIIDAMQLGGSERDSSYSGTSISGEAATERVSGGVHPEPVSGDNIDPPLLLRLSYLVLF